MVLRFFLFIWATILVTMLAFALFIQIMGWSAPPAARYAMASELASKVLIELSQQQGMDEALADWRQISPAFEGVDVIADPRCVAAVPIATRDNRCIEIRSPQSMTLLSRTEPMWLPLLFGAMTSAIVALMISRWLSHPLRTVNEGLHELAGGKFSTRIGPRLKTSNAEVAGLIGAFDHAASRLQSLSDGRKRLFHDISHEIRSPLARLQAALSLLERRPQEHERMLNQMGADIARLDLLVGEILTLARLEQAGSDMMRESLDIIDILEPIIADANFEGQARNIKAVYHGPDKIQFIGNEELLHRGLENIVRNAVYHSPDDGKIEIKAEVTSNDIELTFCDQGPGVPEADLDNIFKPFFRIRNSNRSNGAGLGLSIAARGIAIHRGTICAHNRAGGGLSLSVHLPVD